MRLHAMDQGSGPPLCLLHGLFGRSQNFTTLIKTASQHHRVIALDLRNHGASPHAPEMSYRVMAADVLETLAELNALPCCLLGHSMGGKVAMTAALAAPTATTQLIVADIAPMPYHHGNAAITQSLIALPLTPALTRRDADAALAGTVADAAIRGFLLQNLTFGAAPAWRIGLAEIAAAIPQIEDWPDGGGVYQGPTLLIRGGASDYVPDTAWPAITALFPRARLVTLAGAGHWLHADRPAEFAAAILQEQGAI